MNKRQPERTTVAAPAAVTEHGVDHAHETRVDGLSEEHATHLESAQSWKRPSNLDAPPARAGMTQRWVRRSVRGVVDTKNLNRAHREGWRAVPPESLSDEWRVFSQYANKAEGVVVVDDMQLMEIPTKIIEAKRRAIEEQTKLQMEGVMHDLERSQVAGHPILRDHKSTVSYPGRKLQAERRVEPASDE